MGAWSQCVLHQLLTEDLRNFPLLSQPVARLKINSRTSSSDFQTSIPRTQADVWHNGVMSKVHLWLPYLLGPPPLPQSSHH